MKNKVPGRVELVRTPDGMYFKTCRSDKRHEMLVHGDEDCDTPHTQWDIVHSLYDTLQCEDHFAHGDIFVLEGRAVARVDGIHVVPVTAEEAVRDFGLFAFSLRWPGSISLRVHETRADGERDWENIRIEVMPLTGLVDIRTSLTIREGDSDWDWDERDRWNNVVDGITATICQMVFSKAVEFRSFEFETAVKELCDTHLANQF